MIHSGAILGAGLSQGKSQTLGLEPKVLAFRNDLEKRDASVCGASAGVAAAFGAPIGGVLFALEEGASHWFQSLTWRAFFAAIISAYVTDMALSYIYGGTFGRLTKSGMFSFGDYGPAGDGSAFQVYEIPVFIAIGAGGGLIGAAFNGFNALVTRWRMARMNTPLRRLVEPVAIATTFAVLSFCLPLVLSVCRDRSDVPKGYDYGSELVTFYCPDGQYNELATLLVAPSENAIKQLFHAPTSFSFEPSLLVLFFFLYSSTTALTYGTAVPSGLFIPSLLAGSAYGRCVGQALNVACPGCFARPGLYALVGAAAVLGGMARMTISLCVILLESTGDLTFGMPLMVVLMASRWVGNVFNEGLYDIHIHLNHFPIIEHKPTKQVFQLSTQDIMSHSLVTVPLVARVGDIFDMLSIVPHNGFPVLYPNGPDGLPPRGGNLAGIIYRKHLCVLLKHGTDDKTLFRPAPSHDEAQRISTAASLGMKLIRRGSRRGGMLVSATELGPQSRHSTRILEWHALEGIFPRYPAVKDIVLTEQQRQCYIDLRPYIHASPYTVSARTPANQTFRLFRDMGLRHIVVVDGNNDAVGMVTRHDLTHSALSKSAAAGAGLPRESMRHGFDDATASLLQHSPLHESAGSERRL